MFGKCSVEWMRMIRVAAAAPAPGSGRANSSAAIVIDVASSGTVRSTTYSKQKLEAAADRATYSSSSCCGIAAATHTINLLIM